MVSDAPRPRESAIETGLDAAQGALFVMPTPGAGQSGPVAVWITAAGWTAAAQRLWGHAWMVTPHGVLSPEAATRLATSPNLSPPGRRWHRGAPPTVRTAVKDLRQIARARRYRSAALNGPWTQHDVAFVWQRHDLFHTAGFRAARALRKPVVLFVDAPLVWEARKWGIRRPGWATLAEVTGERPQFMGADLIACVSEEVASEVEQQGVSRDRIQVTPCGVELDVFTPSRSGEAVRRRLGLEGKFVVGWVGSFRGFHGVDLALRAASLLRDRIPDLALLLVGDGLERPRIEKLTVDLGLSNVVFTGTVGYQDVASHIAAMDVTLVLDRGDQAFHYSPLKLKEYAACGRAIIAPRVGELGRLLLDGVDSVLVPSGDPGALAGAIEELHGDPELRERLGSHARAKAVHAWSWDRQLRLVVDALGSRGQAAERLLSPGMRGGTDP